MNGAIVLIVIILVALGATGPLRPWFRSLRPPGSSYRRPDIGMPGRSQFSGSRFGGRPDGGRMGGPLGHARQYLADVVRPRITESPLVGQTARALVNASFVLSGKVIFEGRVFVSTSPRIRRLLLERLPEFVAAVEISAGQILRDLERRNPQQPKLGLDLRSAQWHLLANPSGTEEVMIDSSENPVPPADLRYFLSRQQTDLIEPEDLLAESDRPMRIPPGPVAAPRDQPAEGVNDTEPAPSHAAPTATDAISANPISYLVCLIESGGEPVRFRVGGAADRGLAVGRSAASNLLVEDRSVSSRHLVGRVIDGVLHVQDVSSTGTWMKDAQGIVAQMAPHIETPAPIGSVFLLGWRQAVTLEVHA